MGKSTAFQNANLLLFFNNQAIPLIGDASGIQPSATAGSLWLGLYTADPSAGNQLTSEATYGGYARIAVVRSSLGWTVVGNVASNATLLSFPACVSGGPETETYVGVGTAGSGAGSLMYSAQVVSPSGGLIVVIGETPQISIGAATFTET